MTNLHAPQRLENETREAYSARRKASQQAARATRYGTPNTDRFVQSTNPEKHAERAARRAAKFSGAEPKPLKVRTHKPKKAVKATWPDSKDQRAQSRPVIVSHPVRALGKLMVAAAVPDKDGVRSRTDEQRRELRALGKAPKHSIPASV